MIGVVLLAAFALGAGAGEEIPRINRATIKPSAAVYVDMPVWVEIQLPSPLDRSLRYPMRIRPNDFSGHQFEVWRHGVLLAPSSAPHPLPCGGGGPGGPGLVGSGGLISLPNLPKNLRRMLRRLVAEGTVRGQADICTGCITCGSRQFHVN